MSLGPARTKARNAGPISQSFGVVELHCRAAWAPERRSAGRPVSMMATTFPKLLQPVAFWTSPARPPRHLGACENRLGKRAPTPS